MIAADWFGRRGVRGSSLVELLVASALGLVVVLAATKILHVHAALALQAQADLAASATATWALRTALRDVRMAGADPQRSGLAALVQADEHSMTLLSDQNGDGLVDDRSRETIGVQWTASGGGGLSRRIGRQSMVVATRVPRDGLRLRYYDGQGREIPTDSLRGALARRRVRLVRIALGVDEALGERTGHASLVGAAAIRVREGLE